MRKGGTETGGSQGRRTKRIGQEERGREKTRERKRREQGGGTWREGRQTGTPTRVS